MGAGCETRLPAIDEGAGGRFFSPSTLAAIGCRFLVYRVLDGAAELIAGKVAGISFDPIQSKMYKLTVTGSCAILGPFECSATVSLSGSF